MSSLRLPSLAASPWSRYALALAFWLLALGLRVMLLPASAGFPFLIFYPFLLGCLLVCGFGPGMLMAALSAATALYLFIPPFNSFVAGPEGALGVAIFLLAAWVTASIVRRMRAVSMRAAALFDSAFGAMVALDAASLCIVEANAAALQLWRYGPSDIIGERFDALLHPQEQAACRQRLDQLLSGSLAQTRFECRYRRLDGGDFWGESQMAAVRDDAGKVVMIIASTFDVTQRRLADESLRTLSIAVEQSPTSVVITDTASNIVYVNPRFTEVTGFTAAEAVGRNPRLLQSGLTPREVYATMWSRLKAGQPWHGELVNRKKDGAIYWEEAYIAPVKNPDGSVISYVAIKYDVSDRKSLEIAREEALGRLLKIAEHVPGMVFQYRLRPDGSACFPFASNAIVDIYGVSADAVRTDATAVRERTHPEDRAALELALAESARTAKPWQQQFRILRTDGEVRWIGVNAAPQREDDGATLWHGFLQDITQRKRAENELTQRERYQRALLDNFPYAVWLKDTDSRFLAVNEGFARIFGANNAEEMVGKSDFDIAPFELAMAYRADDEEVRRSGKKKTMEEQILTGGRLRWFETHKAPVLDVGGELLGTVGFARDITDRREADEAIRRESEKSLVFLRNASDGVHIMDSDGVLIEVSDSFCSMLGYRREQMLGMHVSQWDAVADREQLVVDITAQLQGRFPHQFETRHRRQDGSTFEVEISSNALQLQGRMVLFASARDITQRKAFERSLALNKQVLDATQDGFWLVDRSGRLAAVNQAYANMSGYAVEQLGAMQIGDLEIALASDADVLAHLERIVDHGSDTYESTHRRKDGSLMPVEITCTYVRDAERFAVFIRDITTRRESEEQIRNLAFYDTLTQLPNRRLMQDRLRQALAASSRSGMEGALLFIDLDNFKTLNDTLGHKMGDELLKQVAQRLVSTVRDGDTVARFGGDEFVIVLENLSKELFLAAERAEDIGEKIAYVLNLPYQLGEHESHVTSSIGVALFNKNPLGVDGLFKQADIAMYQAKKAGRNTLRFFDPQMQETIDARAALEVEMRRALDRGEFELFYQVQVDGNGRVHGAEALIRWRHAERGLVPPGQFIPLAEETGLIVAMGQWVLDAACAQLAHWKANPLMAGLTLSINVSARQFRQVEFVDDVRRTVRRHGIAAAQLMIEITESTLLEDIDDTIAIMSALREIGVRFSLDDFGTGYSSLQYLKRLPIDELKIDQSFVRDIVVDASDKAIVSTIIAMASTLSVDVIAEGVETQDQRMFLRGAGCRLFQGYLFGKPLPIEAFEQSLAPAIGVS